MLIITHLFSGTCKLIEQIKTGPEKGIQNYLSRFIDDPSLHQILVDKTLPNSDSSTNLMYWYSAMIKLMEKKVSAVIAPNDRYAWGIHWWLRTAGYKIPEDISLISYDNYVEENPARISSLDFGFGYLGYAAFHLINRSIPIKTDKKGNIASQPYVADYGTVGNLRS